MACAKHYPLDTRLFLLLVVVWLWTSGVGLVLANDRASATSNPEKRALAITQSSAWQVLTQVRESWLFWDIYDAKVSVQKQQNSLDVKMTGLEEDELDGKTTRLVERILLQQNIALKLELCYLRAVRKEDFIKAANGVLPKSLNPQLAEEVSRLHQSYQDVKSGDCYDLSYIPAYVENFQSLRQQLNQGGLLKVAETDISASQQQQGLLLLTLNDKAVFASQSADLKPLYFGIWLGENSLSPKLKDRLEDIIAQQTTLKISNTINDKNETQL